MFTLPCAIAASLKTTVSRHLRRRLIRGERARPFGEEARDVPTVYADGQTGSPSMLGVCASPYRPLACPADGEPQTTLTLGLTFRNPRPPKPNHKAPPRYYLLSRQKPRGYQDEDARRLIRASLNEDRPPQEWTISLSRPLLSAFFFFVCLFISVCIVVTLPVLLPLFFFNIRPASGRLWVVWFSFEVAR